MAMPSQFYPSDNTNTFSISRQAYINNVGKRPLSNYNSNADYAKKKKWKKTF
jgi:hypothetical protein